ncbi:MAG: hypothetical protein ACOVVK_18725 [Elsteraceae bacterium]
MSAAVNPNDVLQQARDKMARELSSRLYGPEDLPRLAQGIYVRALLAVRASSGGRVANVKPAAYALAADTMTKILGQPISAGQVQQLIDGPPPPKPGTGLQRAKGR